MLRHDELAFIKALSTLQKKLAAGTIQVTGLEPADRHCCFSWLNTFNRLSTALVSALWSVAELHRRSGWCDTRSAPAEASC